MGLAFYNLLAEYIMIHSYKRMPLILGVRGAYLYRLWFQWRWPHQWLNVDITIKEQVPVLLACAVWGRYIKIKVVLFQCDNTAVVAALQNGSKRNDHSMHMYAGTLVLQCTCNTNLQVEHIAGINNCKVDQLFHKATIIWFPFLILIHRQASFQRYCHHIY